MSKAKKSRLVGIKVESDVAESARLIAAIRGIQISELLSTLLRPILGPIEDEALSERVQSRAEGKPRKVGARDPK